MPSPSYSARRLALHLGWIAPLWLAAALAAAAALLPGAAAAPIGSLGAVGAPGAAWFNALGLVLPGLMLLAFSIALESILAGSGAGRTLRLGTGMLMISALAFAAQGAFPFDPSEPDGAASQRYAAALALSQLALVAASAFAAAGLRRAPRWRALAWGGLLLGATLALFLACPPQQLFPPLEGRPAAAQRLVLAAYFGWFALAAVVALRRVPQTSPVA